MNHRIHDWRADGEKQVFMFGGFDDEIVTQHVNFKSGGVTPTPAGLRRCGMLPRVAGPWNIPDHRSFGISAGHPAL